MKKLLLISISIWVSWIIVGVVFAADDFDMMPGQQNTAQLPSPTSVSTDNNADHDAVDNTDTNITPVTQIQSTQTPDAQTNTTDAADTNSLNTLGNSNQSRTAFTNMVRNLMPLSPQQILTLRGMFDQTQQVVAQSPGVPPRPTSSSILVNMSPGATPPVIRLHLGYVTSLDFIDSPGQPWPVVGYDLGDPKSFNIQPSAPDGKSNTLIVQALSPYTSGNLAIMLKNENTPVMLTLMAGQRAIDYRVDLRMPGLGPNALVAMNGLPDAENPALLNFLDGVPPQGATLLTVEGAAAQAWLYQNKLYLRTRVSILSPGWLSSMSSSDGTHVFELEKTPVILALERGEMIQLSIKGL